MGGRQLEVREPGKWKIIVTDNGGCVTKDSIEVGTAIVYPEISGNATRITCYDPFSSIDLNVDNLIDSVKWTGPVAIPDNTFNFQSSSGGIFRVDAYASNGCDTTISINVPVDTTRESFSIGVPDTITCDRPVIEVGALGGNNIEIYEWSTVEGSIIGTNREVSITNSGVYILGVAGANGCFSRDTVLVVSDTLTPFVETFPDTITCRKPRPFLEFSTNINNPTVEWNGPGGFNSDHIRPRTEEPGLYTVSVSGNNGCPASAQLIIVDDNNPPTIELDSITYLFCDSTSVPINLVAQDSNLTYQWFFNGSTFLGDSSQLTADSAGIYTVFITGVNGCRRFDSTEAVIDTRLPEFNTFTNLITCIDTSVTIGAAFLTPDVTWQWDGPNGFSAVEDTLLIEEPGDYFITVIGQNRCVDTATVVVLADNNLPILEVDQSSSIQCENRIIQLDASRSTSSHGASFSWTTPDGIILSGSEVPVVTIQDPGQYQLKMVDNFNGCQDSLLLTISETPQEFLDFELSTSNPFCFNYKNGSIKIERFIGGYGPYEVSLDGIFFAQKTELPFLEPGNYTVTVRDSFGCVLSKDATIEAPNPIFVNIMPDTLIRFGDSITILTTPSISFSDISQIIWSPTNNLSCSDCIQPVARPERTTKYSITIVDQNGCEVSNEVIIRVDEESDIAIPTIFRPTSNQGNDRFFIPQTRGIESIKYLSVYDRWGNRMYHEENFLPGDPNLGWDGKFQGQSVSPAVFTVIAEFRLINGENKTIVSDVTLIR
jgi:hypothetical protein